MPRPLKILALHAVALVALIQPAGAAAKFPNPPPDWRIELVAETPAITHPSVVCTAPDGRVFAAEDPMDISAPANATHGRIVCFHPDGHRTVFATNLYAVFGMQYVEGKLYVLHNPRFSVFTDDNGAARERADLIESTHPNPWALDWNDHVPANFKLAMDGYFYLATGDKGIYGAVGRDGKRLDLHGGGVVRLRPDGTGLETYCRGVRNILDVALNSEDEIFTYDNTDEHDWMGRLTHMVDGGFYGYPHDFVPRRPYTLWMMADFGAGAATGTFAYTEDALPAEYHDNLFLGDFGKRQVLRVRIERDGGTYRVVSKEEMFPDPPEDFRPVGIALSADGLGIYICDWAHRDTKEDVRVGRLWRLTYTAATRATAKPSWYLSAALGKQCDASHKELIDALSHTSKNVRLTAQREIERRLAQALNSGGGRSIGPKLQVLLDGLRSVATNTNNLPYARWHALWALQSTGEVGPLVAATLDPNPTVRQQGLRGLGTKVDPAVVSRHLSDANASVRFEAAAALGRAGDAADVPVLIEHLNESDFFTRYALFTALNRIGRRHPQAWSRIAKGLEHDDPKIREGAEFALRETYDGELLSALEAVVGDVVHPLHTREAAMRLLAEMHHQLAPWKGEWWAYHPALQPPAPRATDWSGTQRVLTIMRERVEDPAASIRKLAVEGIAAARDTNAFSMLLTHYKIERELPVRRAIVSSAGAFKDAAAGEFALDVLRDSSEPPEIAREAVLALDAMAHSEAAAAVADLLRRPALDRDLRLAVLNTLGNLKATKAASQVADQINSDDPSIQTAALRALGKIGGQTATAALRDAAATLHGDGCNEAIKALGALRDTNSVPNLLRAWHNSETQQTALEALARMSDIRALDAYLAGLGVANPATRDLCRKALRPMREQALPEIEKRIGQLNAAALAELREVYTNHPMAAKLFVSSTPIPAVEEYEKFALQHDGDPARGRQLFADQNGVACIKCHSVGNATATLSTGGIGADNPRPVRTIGPDLTSIGTQFARPALIEHVLYPSKAVREGYAQTIVETSDAETVSGLVQSETPEELTLLDAGGIVHQLPKRKITQRTTSSFSLMPEGLQTGLTPEQFSDLIAYLESLKGEGSTAPK